MFFLTIEGGNLILKWNGEYLCDINSAVEYYYLFNDISRALRIPKHELPIYASSSVDFPEEFTDREDVIHLCNLINSLR